MFKLLIPEPGSHTHDISVLSVEGFTSYCESNAFLSLGLGHFTSTFIGIVVVIVEVSSASYAAPKFNSGIEKSPFSVRKMVTTCLDQTVFAGRFFSFFFLSFIVYILFGSYFSQRIQYK